MWHTGDVKININITQLNYINQTTNHKVGVNWLGYSEDDSAARCHCRHHYSPFSAERALVLPWALSQPNGIFEPLYHCTESSYKYAPVSYTHLDVYKRQECDYI